MRLAVIADIHANLLALEAVLADIRRRGADLTVDLGDCVSGPLWPRETIEVLASLKLPTVRGNHERQLLAPRAAQGLSDGYSFDRLTAEQVASLGRLPLTLSPVDGVTMFHATPTDDNTPLLEREAPGGNFALAPRSAIAAALGNLSCEVALCGHTHNARIVRMPRADGGSMLIVNPGSVGLQAFGGADEHFGSGSPHARYAILTKAKSAWSVELITLDYDWDRAAKQAAANNRPDWELAIATGFGAV